MATSFWRSVARAKRRFATFAQAIRRTNPTAPSRTRRAGRILPTIISDSGTTPALQPSFESGYCFRRRAAMVSISTCAAATVVPGLRRANTFSQCAPRPDIASLSKASGAQTSERFGKV